MKVNAVSRNIKFLNLCLLCLFASSSIFLLPVFARAGVNWVDVQLSNADLQSALIALQKHSNIKYALFIGESKFDKINVALPRVRPEDALKYICQSAGASFAKDKNGVYNIWRGNPPSSILAESVQPLVRLERIKVYKRDAKDIFEILTKGLGEDSKDRESQPAPFTTSLGMHPNHPYSQTGSKDLSEGFLINQNLQKVSYPLLTPQQQSASNVDIGHPASEVLLFPETEREEAGQILSRKASSSKRSYEPISEMKSFQIRNQSRGSAGSFSAGIAGGQGLIPEGINYIAWDPTDNSILVQGEDASIEKLEKTVRVLDKAPKQIVIKVEFIETQLDAQRGYGIDWSTCTQLGSKVIKTGSFTKAAGSTTPGTTDGSRCDGLTGDAAEGSGTFSKLTDNVFFKLFRGEDVLKIRASLDNSNARLIDAPLLRTFNNKEATAEFIETRTKLVDKTVLQDGSTPFVTKDPKDFPAARRLTVKPRANADGTITVNLKPLIEKFEDNTSGDFSRKTSNSIDLVANVQDGETIVVSALTTKKDTRVYKGLPLLANIPVLNKIFGRTEVVTNDRELLIFVTTKVINDEYPMPLP